MHSGNWIRTHVRDSVDVPTLVKIQLAWSQSVTGPQDRILVGDQVSSNLFYLEGKTRREYVAFPKLDDMNTLIAWMRQEKIRFMFVDIATALYNPQIFGEYYRPQRPGLLNPLKPLPPPFKRVPADPRMPKILDLYVLLPDQL